MAINPWRDRAQCRDADPNLFVLLLDTPDLNPTRRWAEAVVHCKVCPVRGECFEDGTRNKMDGVWGGKLLSLGVVEKRVMIPPKCQGCGTDLQVGRLHQASTLYCNQTCESAAESA